MQQAHSFWHPGQVVGQLGTGRNGTMKLMRNKKTKALVAAKWVPRTQGGGLSKNTEREIVNHRKLVHPNIIRFHEVRLCRLRLSVQHSTLEIGALRGPRSRLQFATSAP